jgi:hypothetical protein
MSYYILHSVTNCPLLHLFNTIEITILNTDTKVISELILIDLVVLHTIIHKRMFHIYLHNHSQKECFHTYIYISSHLSCTIFQHVLQNHSKKLFTYISSIKNILHKMEASDGLLLSLM